MASSVGDDDLANGLAALSPKLAVAGLLFSCPELPGFGVVQDTHLSLSLSFVIMHVGQDHWPAFGPNFARRDESLDSWKGEEENSRGKRAHQ